MEASWLPKKRATDTEIQKDILETKDDNKKTIPGDICIPFFTVDHSIKGTAKCKLCKKVIVKGDLRIGKSAAFKEKVIIKF